MSDLLAELRDGYDLVDEWSSRTSRLSRFRSSSHLPPEVVVKVCERWTGADARTSFESARRLAPLAAARARVIEFVTWSAEPPALVSEWVGGEELATVVRRSPAAGGADLEALIAAAGVLLGRAHRLPIPEGARTKPEGRKPRRRVLSAGDFAAYNFRLDGAGSLVYIEPPSALRVVSAYRDLAWFVASLHALLPERGRLRRALGRAFLGSYRAAVGTPWGLLDEVHLRAHVLRRRRAGARRHRRIERAARSLVLPGA